MSRIAVIGAGVSGLVAARALDREGEVTVFEQADYPGGHTHTHTLELQGRTYRVDSGFIVCNALNYPNFTAMLDELEVPLLDTEMSFSVSNAQSGLEYNPNSIPKLFCQKRNVVRPAFWRMLADIRRFYQAAPALLESDDPGPSTGEYLMTEGYSAAFINDHLIPMASALWSAPPSQIMQFPMRYMVQFFHHHQMLKLKGRPQWRVVRGGSASYVEALIERLNASVELNCPVQVVRRNGSKVEIQTGNGTWQGDRVIFACHSDQALALLADPSDEERDVLGAIPYQSNDTVLHTDERLLPRRRPAWAAWNARVDSSASKSCTVTYNMNILQRLEAPVTFCVTLNQTDQIDPEKILARMQYQHPVYTRESVAAQAKAKALNGRGSTFYCGAWQGWGFHEDGVVSGLNAASALRESLHA
ncbi:MAG: FAD-dependent oxidoreductase [Pseudomonadota bacterium]